MTRPSPTAAWTKTSLWEKGEAIAAAFTPLKTAISYLKLSEETKRDREHLKKWHSLYERWPDRGRKAGEERRKPMPELPARVNAPTRVPPTAEIILGEILREMEKNKGAQGIGPNAVALANRNAIATHKELGVSKDLAAESQALAGLSEDVKEEAKAKAKGRQREHGGTAPGKKSLMAKMPPVSGKSRAA